MYIPINQLTDQYIQSLITRCGFTDVSAHYAESLYSIKDLEQNVTSFMGMDGARRWLIQQSALIHDGDTASSVSYPFDAPYSIGTVVCPGAGVLTKCTHDNCPCPFVVSNPNSIAEAGQCYAKTAFDITPRTLVVSDGRGGVRAAAPGETAYVLGVALSETAGAQVLLILKSYFGGVS